MMDDVLTETGKLNPACGAGFCQEVGMKTMGKREWHLQRDVIVHFGGFTEVRLDLVFPDKVDVSPRAMVQAINAALCPVEGAGPDRSAAATPSAGAA